MRVDLDALEGALAAGLGTSGTEVAATGDDSRLVVAAPGVAPDRLAALTMGRTGLPRNSVQVLDLAELPRTASQKIDYPALRSAAIQAASSPHGGRPPVGSTDLGIPSAVNGGQDPAELAALCGRILGRSRVEKHDSFVSLGGDSLSYVECAVALEEVLGALPADWHLRTMTELARMQPAPQRRRFGRLETSVVLRAVGIVAIVTTHMRLWYFPGGAHLLLAVVGYNVSRFLVARPSNAERVRTAAATAARVVVPAAGLMTVAMATVGGYGWPSLLFVNSYLGPTSHLAGRWHYWFIEALLILIGLTVAALAVPAIRRVEREHRYAFPLAGLALALVFRYEWVQIGEFANLRFRAHGVAWFFLLGWLVHRSRTVGQRLLTSAICLAIVPGFFNRPEHEWFIILGVMALIWIREIPLPRRLVRPVALVAAASMWIFITHFRVWPPLDRNLPGVVALILTLGVGIGAHLLAERLLRWRRSVPQTDSQRRGACGKVTGRCGRSSVGRAQPCQG